MGLNFTINNAHNVNFGTLGSLAVDPLTVAAWVNITSITGFHTIFMAGGAFILNATTTNTIRIFKGGTVAGNALASNNSLTLSTWQFVAGSYDSAAGSTWQLRFHIYVGSLMAAATEVSYASGADGSGPVTGTANNKLVGSTDPDCIGGNCAAVWVFPRVLSLAELRLIQFHQTWTGAAPKLFSHLGLLGTGTQPDWSGNGNTGTITGATLAAHAPLGPLFGWDSSLSPAQVAAAAVLEQSAFRWRNDDGGLGAP